jgi:two-component system alkaline phosphatase synthesis response regulator PhoP
MPRKKILIADDEAHVRIVLGRKLESAGFEVVSAIDGQDALELLTDFVPDLIVTDLQMPRMTGLEFCHKIRNDPSLTAVPAIILTSRGDMLTDEQKTAAGIQHILDKPFSPRQLLSLVQSLLAEKLLSEAA